MSIDFIGLREALLPRLPELIPEYLPGGRLVGREWWCANINGGQGDSFKFNFTKGVGKDFSTDEPGGDLIAIHSRQRGQSMGDAAKELASRIGFGNGGYRPPPVKVKRESEGSEHVAPPPGTPLPLMEHFQHGKPSQYWVYRSATGSAMFCVARYDLESGKQVIPWTWSPTRKDWVAKAWKAPRPLYGLDDLAGKPGKPVMIVEGEKAADAARRLCGDHYAVVTWQGGSKAMSKADFTPTHGRAVAIWPDADKPGVEAAQFIAQHLAPHAKEIKVIDVMGDYTEPPLPEGWDAADAEAAGWTWEKFYDWARPRVKLFTAAPTVIGKPKPPEPVAPPPAPAPTIIAQNVQVNHYGEDAPPPADEDNETERSRYAMYEEYGVQTTKQGVPIQNLDNVLRVLTAKKDFKQAIWFDEFHMRRFTTLGGDGPRPFNKNDERIIMLGLQRELGFSKVTAEAVNMAVWVYAMRDRRCEPRDWMATLKWDGTERIESFFVRGMGAQDTPYARAIAKNWFISMVARIFAPGCKVDHMVILEGEQGRGKSSALDLLGGAWYVDCGEPVQNKDFYLTLRGRLIVEISELDAFIRSESTTVKSAVTRRTDVFRPPYGEDAEAFPRRCVFVGTTNEDEYLRDHTGARRFWPLKTGEIDIGYIAAEREQLFAEAVHRFKHGEPWFGVPEEALAEQELRRQKDEWEHKVRDWLKLRNEVTLLEVAEECLKIEVGRFDMGVKHRLGRAMRAIGWRSYPKNGVKVWTPKDRVQHVLPFDREPGAEG